MNVPVVSGGLFLSIINIIDINNNECTASNNIIDTILKLRERERERRTLRSDSSIIQQSSDPTHTHTHVYIL